MVMMVVGPIVNWLWIMLSIFPGMIAIIPPVPHIRRVAGVPRSVDIMRSFPVVVMPAVFFSV